MHVLLVDDDSQLGPLLTEYLAGHQVVLTQLFDGEKLEATLETHAFDVLLLDVMLPGRDGFALCASVRRMSQIPIIMLTARGDDEDRIRGLDLGADDYLPKPFNPRELLARMNAVRRRHGGSVAQSAGETSAREVLRVSHIEIDVTAMEVTRDGKSVQLTSHEFRLLLALARQISRPVPREELARAVTRGDYDPAVDRSLDVHIGHLRQKLEIDVREPRLIKTVRGVGYVLVSAKPALTESPRG